MTVYLPRSAWNAVPPRPGPGALDPNNVVGVALHWPGTTTKYFTQDQVAHALLAWQADHMNNPQKRWSDIAYQVAVDQVGRAWQLRGLTTQSAANGDVDVNERYGAILLVLAVGETPSRALIATARSVIADFRRLYPRASKIVPHSAIRPEPTDCPGDLVRAGITRGDYTPPTPTPTPTPTELDEMDANTVIGTDTTTTPPSDMTMGKLVARVNRLYDTTLDGDGTASDQTLLRRLCAALGVSTAVDA